MRMLKKMGVALSSAALFVGVQAHAALPTGAGTAFTDLATAVDDVEAGVWPVITAVLIAFGIIKLVKRGASKV